MQFEMRKREQELLAKIKDQQKELDAIKSEKHEVERELKKKGQTIKSMSSNRVLTRERAKPQMIDGKQKEFDSNHQPIDNKGIVPNETKNKKKLYTDSKTVGQRRSIFEPKPRNDLIQCKKCSRCFAEDRIEKHENICLKTFNKKRKKFDMTKARVKGTDAAKFVKSEAQLKNQKVPKKGDWRKKRKEFIDTLRAAKLAQKHLANGGSLKDLPPPPPMDTSDYLQCPHCLRRFSEAVAERHIPKCKDIKSNKRH